MMGRMIRGRGPAGCAGAAPGTGDVFPDREVRAGSAGLVREIRDAGHLIGNHTMTHPWLAVQSTARVREELAGCNAALEDVLGEKVRFFRPPHGSRRPAVLRAARELGLSAVMWNAMGFDWRANATAEGIAAHLERGIARNRRRGRGSNLLLHDGGHVAMGADCSASVEATRQILERHGVGKVRYVTVDAWNQGTGRVGSRE